ncbi:MAG: CDGSH iron-sulfur domain-containing protein [Rhodospirillaceae bacterium]|nr:CDGSH iron-sulfur domain-containing protein [Rhodospirillaceae bacterium]
MKPAEPVVAATAPMVVELKEGETVWWCACGRSKSQPFCDGSHAGTGLSPREFVATRTRSYAFCCCKQTGKPPLCDGTHNRI